MAKPAFNQVKKQLKISDQAQAIVFVSDRKQARLTALDFVTFSAADEKSKEFLTSEIDQRIIKSISE
jgi:pre-mRNA-splicing helicase BRR2